MAHVLAWLEGFRPAAINGHTVFQWWHVEGKGPEQTTNPVADYWDGAAKRLGQHGDDIEKLMSDAGGHWEGAGADAMQAHLSPLAQWATAAQGVCGQMNGAMNNQGNTWAEAKPKIQQVDDTPPDPGFSDVWPPNYADKCGQWRDTTKGNMQAMQVYGDQTKANLQNMPVFTAPQSSQGQLGVGTGPGPNVDYRSQNPGNVGSYNYSGSRYSGSPSGPYNYQPGQGGPTQPPLPRQNPVPGPLPIVGPEPHPQPLPWQGPISTDPSNANPLPTTNLPGFNDPGASGGQYGSGGSGGVSGGFMGGGFGAGGGDFESGGRAGGAGGRAGAGGFGAENEFGSRGGRGMGAAGGRPGAAGQPGMGAGGRGGKREEDKEHKSPSYLEEIEDVFGTGEKVAPPVIGED